MKKITLGCGIVTVFIIIGCALVLRFLGMALVEYEVITKQSSPNNEYVAVIYTSEAGATTSTSYFVSVLPSNEDNYKNLKFNVFALHYLADGNEIVVTWHNDVNLEISLNSPIKDKDIRRQKFHLEDLSIQYDI